jgi:hypothetical protein
VGPVGWAETVGVAEVMLVLYVGDDWSEGHHDVGLVDAMGRRLARARLGAGVAGIARLHELVAAHVGVGMARSRW